MQFPLINTRADLDAIEGTFEHFQFMEFLRGSMTQRVDRAVRPENYGRVDYDGPEIAPDWEDVEDLSMIARFGFTADQFKEK